MPRKLLEKGAYVVLPTCIIAYLLAFVKVYEKRAKEPSQL